MVRLKNRTGVPISNSCSAALAPVGMTVSLRESSGNLLRKIALAHRRLRVIQLEDLENNFTAGWDCHIRSSAKSGGGGGAGGHPALPGNHDLCRRRRSP